MHLRIIQGITYGDGVSATERAVDDVMSLKSDGTICFLGFAGRLIYHHGNCIKVDYEKYVDGVSEYFVKICS